MAGNQEIIVYLGRSSPEAKRLDETIQSAAGMSRVALCRTIRTLDREIQSSRSPYKIVILLARGKRSLRKLSSLREHLLRLQLIVIVGDAGKRNLSVAFQLYPRYVTLISSNFEDVGSVLGKILKRNENLALMITHGLKAETYEKPAPNY